jgi:3-phosphoshikimate 1-carboxyvinyltransferase
MLEARVRLIVENSRLAGAAEIPASKSHTIRAVFFATLAHGVSHVSAPLVSRDTLAALETGRALGADIRVSDDRWVIEGVNGSPGQPAHPIDVENSGTTLRVGLGAASLGSDWVIFTGDGSIRRRPNGPLIQSLHDLGARVFSTRGDGAAPIAVRGPLRGGRTQIDCVSSQYLTALLLASPSARGDTEIRVGVLNERPYVGMTLLWLDRLGVEYCRKGLEHFIVRGGQRYQGFDRRIPADWSSATFLLAAAAVTGSRVTLVGLDLEDPQGDKAVLGMLEAMGCEVTPGPQGITIAGGDLQGGEFDLNDTPDALPSLAVVAAFAEGETRLLNVPQARVKECDRIAAMRSELAKLGITATELEDGLTVQGGKPRGAAVDSYADHRIAMALAAAGLAAKGTTVVEGAEAIDVTFPNFVELMWGLGAHMRVEE